MLLEPLCYFSFWFNLVTCSFVFDHWVEHWLPGKHIGNHLAPGVCNMGNKTVLYHVTISAIFVCSVPNLWKVTWNGHHTNLHSATVIMPDNINKWVTALKDIRSIGRWLLAPKNAHVAEFSHFAPQHRPNVELVKGVYNDVWCNKCKINVSQQKHSTVIWVSLTQYLISVVKVEGGKDLGTMCGLCVTVGLQYESR